MKYRFKMQRQIAEGQVLWTIIALTIGIDLVWAHAIGIKIVLSSGLVIGFSLMAGINLIYATVRPDQRIAAFASAAAQLTAFSAAAAVLSYLTVTSRFPLIDRYLAAADAAFGLDWLGFFTWVKDHPLIEFVLGLSYGSGLLQVGALLVTLIVVGQHERLRQFVWLFVLTLLIIILLSWVMPAEGAWAYYGVSRMTSAYYLPDFYALRAGTLSEISMARVTGIIQFPSFHAALALILIYVCRGIPYLFPVCLVLNAVMIFSTATWGGHHFSDIAAGLAVVPLAILVLRWGQNESSESGAVALVSEGRD
jgi:membrane-associated phospholipid phosphatase